mmetsp:Transcript_7520/g.21372  ORF Transcript_7520/g.21372 Transcript_7520/m.21372 type:complete len:256 (-) Transcript_7520:264-1031(-)
MSQSVCGCPPSARWRRRSPMRSCSHASSRARMLFMRAAFLAWSGVRRKIGKMSAGAARSSLASPSTKLYTRLYSGSFTSAKFLPKRMLASTLRYVSRSRGRGWKASPCSAARKKALRETCRQCSMMGRKSSTFCFERASRQTTPRRFFKSSEKGQRRKFPAGKSVCAMRCAWPNARLLIVAPLSWKMAFASRAPETTTQSGFPSSCIGKTLPYCVDRRQSTRCIRLMSFSISQPAYSGGGPGGNRLMSQETEGPA